MAKGKDKRNHAKTVEKNRVREKSPAPKEEERSQAPLSSQALSPSPDQIWWRQVGKSLRLLREVERRLSCAESFLLYTPMGLPWEETFRQRLLEVTSGIDPERMLRLIQDDSRSPGRFCLEELCPKDWAGRWWPSTSPADYLCQNESLPFHKLFIWVTGVDQQKRLKEWESFIAEYEQASKREGLPWRAVFILETCLLPSNGKGQRGEGSTCLPSLTYSITESDCRVFCMEALSGQETVGYLVELSIQVGASRPEVCYALLKDPKALFAQPMESCKSVLTALSLPWQEEQLYSLIWRAQARQFFPLLEECRMFILKTHAQALSSYLPVSNEYGKLLTDTMDLEFRDIQGLVAKHPQSFPSLSANTVNTCRLARNLLAHSHLLTREQVEKLLELRSMAEA